MPTISIQSLFDEYATGRRDFRGTSITSVDGWVPPRFADLSGLMFDEATVSGISFEGADLRHSSFVRATLAEVDLSNSVLIETNFSYSEIRGSDLKGACCTEANFEGARLGADLSDAMMSNACFTRVDFRGGKALSASFTGANLRFAVLTEVNLAESCFNNADLSGADVCGADLTGAQFKNASLVECRANSALLNKALFDDADVEGISLTAASLNSAQMVKLVWLNSDLSGARLRSAHLEGSTFRSCNLEKADATHAFLSETVLINCNLTGIDLTHAWLTRCLWQNVVLDSATVEGADFTNAALRHCSGRATLLSQEQRSAASIDKDTLETLPEPATSTAPARRLSNDEEFPSTAMMFKVHPQTDASIVRVYYATDRRPTAERYGPDRDDRLRYGTCDVSIPRDHRMGELEAPSIWRLEIVWNEQMHIVIKNTSECPPSRFFEQLRRRAKASRSNEAFVFIHGFNVSFEDAVRRVGQMAYDLSFDGPAIAYSWASRADVKLYTYDEATVEDTIPRLKAFIEEIVASTGVQRLHLIAHSMGNRAMSRAIEQLTLGGANLSHLKHIILAAPDIDAGVFKGIAARLCAATQNVTLYGSSNDLAIQLSKKVHGYRRAGEGGRYLTIVEGVSTIDASGLDTDLLGHSYVADHRSVMSDIFYLLQDQPPQSRFGLQRARKGKREYWIFRSGGHKSLLKRLLLWWLGRTAEVDSSEKV